MDIIIIQLPHSALPLMKRAADDDDVFIIDEDGKLCKLDDKKLRFMLPMRGQKVEKLYNFNTSLWKKIKNFFLNSLYSDIFAKSGVSYEDFQKEINIHKQKTEGIINLFEAADCYEMRVVEREEILTFSDCGGVKCVWRREVGYYGFKENEQ